MVSFYVQPENSDIEVIMADIVDDVRIVKNSNGDAYWPEKGINQIINWKIEEGYQVQMHNPATLTIRGTLIDPASTRINLAKGWSMVGYLRNSPLPAEEALSSIMGDLRVLKDNDGNVFWPEHGINEIGSLQPGQGYKIYMNRPGTLIYPAN